MLYNASVSSISETETLVRSVVRLRRAERDSPHADITAARRELERLAGSTVSRAMAARLLGVSQPALSAWIASGDVPIVMGRSGRWEVPLHALLDLTEAVDRRKRAGGSRHSLAAVLRELRLRADGLDTAGLVPERSGRSASGHRGAELLGLAYHRAVARRLDDALVQRAQERLARWRAEGRIHPAYASAWDELLSQSLAHIRGKLGEDSRSMRELRQSSPFAGALSEPERRAVLDAAGQSLQPGRPR
jgi:hypothetical protein